MCGIFGYIGPRTDAGNIVLRGLKKLEYRGYDSWGVVAHPAHPDAVNDALHVTKMIGKIGDVTEESCAFPTAQMAVGHSRWATHGGVTDQNAHPHTDESGEIAVVHNGIIENFQELKARLAHHTFSSETDTEVLPHLIEEYMHEGFEGAVRRAIQDVHGRFALVAMKRGEPQVIAARRGSPLIIGEGDGEFFISSDIPAFLEYTRTVRYLDDNEMVLLGNTATFKSIETGNEISKRLVTIQWDAEEAEKGEHPHFMIKEILEQKETIRRAINQDQALLETIVSVIKNAYGVFFVGCGTAGKVCMAASYIFSEVAQRHVNVVFGSEFESFHHFLKKGGLLVAISQSGETADTLEAIEVAKSKGMTIVSIVNVEGSTMARMSDYVLPLKVGPEKAVASTKATTAQIALVTLLAYGCAGKFEEGQEVLIRAASAINDMLNPRYEERLHECAKQIVSHESMYVIGKGVNYPMALEASIKIQEVSYIHAEGFASGELKHGPLALIGQGTPCIALIANDSTKRDIINNAMEIKARGGFLIGVAPEPNEIFDVWLRVPDVDSIVSSIINIIPIQILAYHLAMLRGHDPDHPRNLAKSVTVK